MWSGRTSQLAPRFASKGHLSREDQPEKAGRTLGTGPAAGGGAVPLLGDLGVTGQPQEAAAAHIADRSRLITAVSRTTNYIDAFWVDADRRIMTTA
jgi:hypothetical protein